MNRMNANWRAGACVMLAVLLSGCGAGSGVFSSSNETSGTPSMTQRFKDLFGSSPFGQAPATVPGGAAVANSNPVDVEMDCPSVDIRSGAATLLVTAKPGDTSALNLRYQGTIARTARQCSVNSGMMTMKVGVEGRIVNGPAGGPGTVDVPLRIAVVQEGPEPKTIASKLNRFTVTVADNASSTLFSQVDSDVTFPLPSQSALEAYVVYVGFDPAPPPPERKKPAPRPRR